MAKHLATILQRIIKLEQESCPCRYSGFVFAGELEAEQAGAVGGVLVIGPIMSPEEWAAAAKIQQSVLICKPAV